MDTLFGGIGVKKRLVLIAVALLIAGCGASARQASALQRLDGDTSILRATSGSAIRVSDDWSRLAASVEAADVPKVERQAGTLLLDSNRLLFHAGKAGVDLRRLRRGRGGGGIRLYVNYLDEALSHEWWEGREAGWTARLLRKDPLLAQGGDAAYLARLVSMTRRSASLAVTYVAAARALRGRERRLFRYVPVGTPISKGGTP